ncbi:MAG: helix-turn-helix transcriptional regulator [Nanoarchaeota archaeon]
MPFIIRSLENLLEKIKLDPEGLAKELHVSRSSVYRWLSGETSPHVGNLDALYSLSETYGLKITFYEKPILKN